MRLGLSVTGIVQSLEKLQWLDECYKELRKFDVAWSKEQKYNPSIKLTTIKPSGTVSLLTGSTPGVHPAYAEYYIRRVRVASDHPLVAYMKMHGYEVEFARKFDKTEDYTTSIIAFPCKAKNAVYAKDMTAVMQLELVKRLQTIWSDNAVSVTVYYSEEELGSIKEWLKENYETSVKSVSFLLRSDHGFDQAPYEEISAAQYQDMVDNLLSLIPFNDYLEMDDADCVTGACPVR